MTFEDMMAMKRLGETAVSPDGQWLAYSVSTESLETNKSTSQWYLQKISGGEPIQLTSLHPGDSGLQFSADGHSVLFLSGRNDSQQIWLAAFDPATGTIGNEHKLTSISTEADNARWSPDGKFIVFTSSVYPDCPAVTTSDNSGDKCNSDRDKAAADKNAEPRQQPPGDDGADDADDNVTDESKAAAPDNHAGEPTGNQSNHDPNNKSHKCTSSVPFAEGRTVHPCPLILKCQKQVSGDT